MSEDSHRSSRGFRHSAARGAPNERLDEALVVAVRRIRINYARGGAYEIAAGTRLSLLGVRPSGLVLVRAPGHEPAMVEPEALADEAGEPFDPSTAGAA